MDEAKKTKKIGKKQLVFIAVIAVIVMSGLFYFNSSGYLYRQSMEQAQRNLQKGNYEEAIEAYQKAYTIYQKKDIEKALKVLDDMALSYDGLIAECMEQEEYEQAQKLSRDAVEALGRINENYRIADAEGQEYLWLSDTLRLDLYCEAGIAGQALAAGEYEKACGNYAYVLERTKGSGGYLSELFQQAEEGLADTRSLWAKEFLTKEDYEGALAQYDALLEKCPGSARGYIGKSNVYLYQNDILSAVEVLNTGCENADTEEVSQRLKYVMENTYRKERAELGRDEEARKIWQYNKNGYIVSETSIGSWGTAEDSFAYDEKGRLQQKISDSGSNVETTVYTYDTGADRLLEEKSEWKSKSGSDRRITTTTHAYYANGSKKEERTIVRAEDGTEAITREYLWDEAGRPLKELDLVELREYQYSDKGTLLKEVVSLRNTGEIITELTFNELGAPVYGGNRASEYTYGENGELVHREYDNGKKNISYYYDSNHKLSRYDKIELGADSVGYNANAQRILDYNEYMTNGIAHDGYVISKDTDYSFYYDDKNRLESIIRVVTTLRLTYEKQTGSYTDANGIVHSDTTGKGFYVPGENAETEWHTTTIEYEECSAEERIASPFAALAAQFFGLNQLYGDVEGFASVQGFASAPYYQYDGNWKIKGYSVDDVYYAGNPIATSAPVGNDVAEGVEATEKPWYYGDVWTRERESLKPWNGKDYEIREQNSMGDALEVYTGNDLYKYRYLYQFEGTIE